MEEKIVYFVKVNISILRWQDEFVVYDQLSGDTHLLDMTSGKVLCQLSEKPMSKKKIHEKLSVFFPDSDQQDIAAYFDGFIARFTSLGLLSETTATTSE